MVKINPFKPRVHDGFLSFGNRKRQLHLFFFPVKDVKGIPRVLERARSLVDGFQGVQHCVHFHWSGGEQDVYFFTSFESSPGSNGSTVDGRVKLDKKFGGIVVDGREIKHAYFLPVDGRADGWIKQDGDRVITCREWGGTPWFHACFHDVNLFNLKYLKDFYRLLHDYATRSGKNMDLQLFMQERSKELVSSGLVTCREANASRLDAIQDYLQSNLRLVLEKVKKPGKKHVASTLLRRDVRGVEKVKIEEGLNSFLEAYFKPWQDLH